MYPDSQGATVFNNKKSTDSKKYSSINNTLLLKISREIIQR